jgi:Leucine-rich repeat (LRR) protein
MYCTTYSNDYIELSSINDIYNIKNPENVKKLWLWNYELTNLDKDIFSRFTQLQDLKLYKNNLTELDKDIFKYNTQLQDLKLYENNLTHVDKDLFKYNKQLQILELQFNNLTHLDKVTFRHNIELEELYLNDNNLTHLDKDLFKYNIELRELSLSNNKLTQLSSSITRCRYLRNISYENNDINYIPPHIQRFLNKLKQQSNNLQVYNDEQYVYYHFNKEYIKTSLENILDIPKTIHKDSLIQNLLDSNISQKGIQLLLEYCQNNSINLFLNITFEEALFHILEFINLHCNENKSEIYSILDQEMQDSECKWFINRIPRLINCLNGFTSLVEI